MLLNTSKAAWKDSKRYLNYILDDATRAFVQLSDNFFYEDMDIFVDDSTKNQQYIDQLKQGAEQWAIARGGRSPRCARQFMNSAEAKIKLGRNA